MLCYKDLIDHLVDYLGADPGNEANRQSRRAALAAYNEVATGHRWSYYYQRGRVTTVAQQTEGTVAYDHTGGTYERMLTITGSTWPTWAPYGIVVLANVPYQIEAYKTTTVITLAANSNPGADVAALTPYTLYRDTYPLPADFQAADEVINNNNTGPLVYLHPREWLNAQRLHSGPAAPRLYCFTGNQDGPGLLHLNLFPAPDQAYNLEFLYQRLPRPLVIDEVTTGFASITVGGTTVVGSGTSWTSRMVGSVIRLSQDSSNTPTGRSGGNPAYLEFLIVSVEAADSLTVNVVATDTVAGVKYSITDPVDIEEGAMGTFLLRELEKQMRQLRRVKATPEEADEHNKAQIKAWESDARNFGRRAAGQSYAYPQRLANMPRGPDVP